MRVQKKEDDLMATSTKKIKVLNVQNEAENIEGIDHGRS